MLAKLMMGGGDFVRSLRRRRLVAFALLGIGIVGVVCYLLFVHGKDTLPDFAQGFYLGASCGICLGAVILLVRVTVLLHSPESQKRAKIEEQDEREKAIVQTAFRWAGIVTFFASAAALLVVVPFSRPAFYALLGAMILYSLAFSVSIMICRRRM